MTVEEARQILNAFVDKEDYAAGTDGTFYAQECNAIVEVLKSVQTIGGLSNVINGDGVALNDYVLVKKAYTNNWEAKTVSSIRQNVDNVVRQGSANPVSSNAVYNSVQELQTAINLCALASDLTAVQEEVSKIQRVIDGGSARTLKLNRVARRIDCGKADRNYRIQHARDTKANWQSENPVLLEGELGLVTDEPGLWKWGDGVTRWNSLPWCGFNGTVAQTTGSSTLAVMSQKAVTDALNALTSFEDEAVNALPSASASTKGKIYLTPSPNQETGNIKDEFITIQDGNTYKWEQIGSTAVDLEGYVTTAEMNAAIEGGFYY